MDSVLNLAFGTVATAPSPATSGTSMTLTTGHGARFPSTSFDMTIAPSSGFPDPTNAEIARVTVSGDTVTLTRAQYGTTARSITAGDICFAGITKQMYDALAFFENVSSLTSVSLAVNSSYIFTASSLATGTLPATANPGDIIRVYAYGSGGVKIAQNSGQKIYGDGTTVTTTGTSGYLSIPQNGSVDLKCLVANNEWAIIDCVGQITTDTGAIARGVRCIIDIYTASGTWPNRAGAVRVLTELQAPGGGGGGGRRGAAASARLGGGGGAQGQYASAWYDPSQLGSTESVTIGAAGTAGAAATSDSTNGGNGGTGGNCSFADLTVSGGGGGTGGTTTTAPGGTAPTASGIFGISLTNVQGGGANTSGGTGTAPSGTRCLPGSAGAGGGLSTSNVAAAGANGAPTLNSAGNTVLAAATGGAATGANGANGANASTGKMMIAGGGGAGGGSGTGVGGTGGTGGSYGGGGGGGAASVNGNNSGPGGPGGPGVGRVTTFF